MVGVPLIRPVVGEMPRPAGRPLGAIGERVAVGVGGDDLQTDRDADRAGLVARVHDDRRRVGLVGVSGAWRHSMPKVSTRLPERPVSA